MDGRATRRGVLVGLLGLSGCGFRPLYARRGGQPGVAEQEMSAIDVTLIPDRGGQLLRQALQQRFGGASGGGFKTYAIAVSFGVTAEAINIQQDSTATRVRETATASWSLKRLDATNTLVANGTARALDGLNVIDQQYFAADLESEALLRRLADAVADQITLQVASYFASHATA